MQELKFKLSPGGIMPVKGTTGSAAFDLFVPETLGRVSVLEGHVTTIDFRVHFEIPPGNAGLLLVRSGIGTRQGLGLANTVGLIDADYRGPIIGKFIVAGPGTERPKGGSILLRSGEPVVQLFVVPLTQLKLVEVAELGGTSRGAGGFGSTSEGKDNGATDRAKNSKLPASKITGG